MDHFSDPHHQKSFQELVSLTELDVLVEKLDATKNGTLVYIQRSTVEGTVVETPIICQGFCHISQVVVGLLRFSKRTCLEGHNIS